MDNTWKTQREQRKGANKPMVIPVDHDTSKVVSTDITAEFIPVIKPLTKPYVDAVRANDTLRQSKSCPRSLAAPTKAHSQSPVHKKRLAYSQGMPKGNMTTGKPISKYDRNKVPMRPKPVMAAEPTCVWTTLVMLNDSYACGAAVVARSLRDVKTKYPIWCMVTPCVSAPCVEFLRTVFDNVVVVELLSHATTKMKTQKQNQIYGSWIHSSFTKWNIWNREYFPFDRVCLCDADMMFLENCDSLFQLQVPAATFASPWVYPYVKSTDGRSTGSHNPYYNHEAQRGLTHGQRVDHAKIRRGFSESILGLACMVLVQPDPLLYKRMREILNARPEYGHVRCVSGFDEQLFADTILDTRTDVYHIHPRYNAIIGKIPWLEGHNPRTQQFYNGKPWHNIRTRADITDSPWEDIHMWWKIADSVLADHPSADIWFYSAEYLAKIEKPNVTINNYATNCATMDNTEELINPGEWNGASHTQVLGRGVRTQSHKELPDEADNHDNHNNHDDKKELLDIKILSYKDYAAKLGIEPATLHNHANFVNARVAANGNTDATGQTWDDRMMNAWLHDNHGTD